MAEKDEGVGLPGVHGVLMILAWLILSELAQTIAWGVSCQTGEWSEYFKKAGTWGARLFNAHRLLNTLAFLLALAAVVIIAVTDEAKEAVSSQSRHVIYGITLMVAVFGQIAFRLAYPEGELSRRTHRWFGRLVGFWAYFCVMTGYELADGDESDGFTTVYVLFALWYGLRLLMGGVWGIGRLLGWIKEAPDTSPVTYVKTADVQMTGVGV